MNNRKAVLRRLSSLKDDGASSLLMLLVAADLVFIVAYFFHVHTSIFDIYLFSLTIDRSYSEIYQYVKEFWIVLLVFGIFVKTREIGYVSWSIFFAYILVDDSFFLHEQLGDLMANRLPGKALIGVQPQDYGELAVIVVSTLLLLGLIGIFYIRGSNRFRVNSRDLLIFLLLLGFFGVFIDVVHASVELGWKGNFLLDVLEDGGEMLVVSLITWYVFLLNARKGIIEVSLFDLLLESLRRQTK
jgi:hypothetical protein